MLPRWFDKCILSALQTHPVISIIFGSFSFIRKILIDDRGNQETIIVFESLRGRHNVMCLEYVDWLLQPLLLLLLSLLLLSLLLSSSSSIKCIDFPHGCLPWPLASYHSQRRPVLDFFFCDCFQYDASVSSYLQSCYFDPSLDTDCNRKGALLYGFGHGGLPAFETFEIS